MNELVFKNVHENKNLIITVLYNVSTFYHCDEWRHHHSYVRETSQLSLTDILHSKVNLYVIYSICVILDRSSVARVSGCSNSIFFVFRFFTYSHSVQLS